MRKINNKNPRQILAFTETWLTPDVDDAEVQIDNYDIIRSDRTISTGGDVAMLLHKNLGAVTGKI